jgi:hypothetical protein
VTQLPVNSPNSTYDAGEHTDDERLDEIAVTP